MAFWIMLIILLLAAVIGGYANFLLPANNGEDGKSKLRGPGECIVLGLAATLMVPVFLELAQSKLLENVHFDLSWEPIAATASPARIKPDTVVISSVMETDSTRTRSQKTDTTLKKAKASTSTAADKDAKAESDIGKNYWLWAAYCVIAAAAGFRFINMLINNVVKQEEIKTLKAKTQELEEDKKKETEKNRLNEQAAEKKEIAKLVSNNAARMVTAQGTIDPAAILPPLIGPITHPDDPQKGRFGGKSINNFRQLRASVERSNVPGFYNVVIWVESTNEKDHPLTEDVIFYIHDSFRPNVYTITPVNGRATDDDILSYGAFTVGAIADHGATLLELDLAEDPAFPKQFRES